MHYSLGQEVYGGHTIEAILSNEKNGDYSIFIKKGDEIIPWKKFNNKMAIAVEFDLKY
tara:strand:- start:109 stop:282 length:174 start_codon:yes stop_codon:yes gene_type:complete